MFREQVGRGWCVTLPLHWASLFMATGHCVLYLPPPAWILGSRSPPPNLMSLPPKGLLFTIRFTLIYLQNSSYFLHTTKQANPTKCNGLHKSNSRKYNNGFKVYKTLPPPLTTRPLSELKDRTQGILAAPTTLILLHLLAIGFVVHLAWVLPKIFTTLTLILCHSRPNVNATSSKQPSLGTEVKQCL